MSTVSIEQAPDKVMNTDRRRKISSARSGNVPRTFLELGDLEGKAGRTLNFVAVTD